MSNILLGKSREIAQRKNEEDEPEWKQCQLWLYLVVKVKSDAVKNSIAWEPGMPMNQVNWMCIAKAVVFPGLLHWQVDSSPLSHLGSY